MSWKSQAFRAFVKAHLGHLLTISTILSWAFTSTSYGGDIISFPNKKKHACSQNIKRINYLPDLAARFVQVKQSHSPRLHDPLIERARELNVLSDFKLLSDLIPAKVDKKMRALITQDAEKIAAEKGERESIRYLITNLYKAGDFLQAALIPEVEPKWKLHSSSSYYESFNAVEKSWKKLIRLTPKISHGTLLPVPYPIAIPGDRFQESYYWDTYFANEAFLQTGRADLARMQVENFLFLIENYGLVPNGLREYYLTRSQPPVLASMIRKVVEHDLNIADRREKTLNWLLERAYPLLYKDYTKFWINPETRYIVDIQLNRHFDTENLARLERHSTDNDALLAQTFRDVRAEAESGKDFTDTFEGRSTEVAPVLLNSILYKAEMDMAWLAEQIGKPNWAAEMNLRAKTRAKAIRNHLWDESGKTFRDYNFVENRQLPYITADLGAILWSGLPTAAEAADIRKSLLTLERKGGIIASNVESGKQWDAPFAWAPQQYFAVFGLKKYGYSQDAERIARNWADANHRIFLKKQTFLEKIDGETGHSPIESGGRYTTQTGFLWTNAVYTVFIKEILNENFESVMNPN